MVIETHTDYAIELDRELFDEDYTESNSYESFMNALISHFKLQTQSNMTGVIKYPGGTHGAISDVSSQVVSDDFLLIDLAEHAWKHRYTFVVRAFTEEGVKQIRKIINKTKTSKTLMDVNQDISVFIN